MRQDGTEIDALRGQLLELLAGAGPHMTFEDAVAGFPEDAMNRRAPNVPYMARNADYVSRICCTAARSAIRPVLARELPHVLNQMPWRRPGPERDLFATVPSSADHTILRQVRYIADHTAYHVGEFAILRQVMGTWPIERNG